MAEPRFVNPISVGNPAVDGWQSRVYLSARGHRLGRVAPP
jgi:hypothetical protein